MMTKTSPADVQRFLKMGPFSGSDMYIVLYTSSDAGFEAATFGFEGDLIELKQPEDVAKLITDRRRVLITNGDEVLQNPAIVQALLQDREKLRHRNLVAIHCRDHRLQGAFVNRFTNIDVADPILP